MESLEDIKVPVKYANRVAKLPVCRPDAIADGDDREEVVWAPPSSDYFENPDNAKKVHEFAYAAVDTSGIEFDKALNNLQKCDYDIDKAKKVIRGMKNCRPPPWSEEDSVLFGKILCAYGKNFRKIKELIPHKSIPEIVAHYYDSKHDEDYKKEAQGDYEEHVDYLDRESYVRPVSCTLCSKETMNKNGLFGIRDPNKKLCKECTSFRRQARAFEETSEDGVDSVPDTECTKEKKKIIHEIVYGSMHLPIGFETPERVEERELEMKARAENENSDSGPLDSKPENYGYPPTKLETEHRLLKEEVNALRAHCMKLQDEMNNNVIEIEASLKEVNQLKKGNTARAFRGRLVDGWTAEDRFFATSAFVRYGPDFKAVAAIVRTKSVEAIENFYMMHKEKLDAKIKQYHDPVADEAKTTVTSFFDSLKISDR